MLANLRIDRESHTLVSPNSLDDQRVAGSFRDPSGFVFERHGVLYRQVNQSYRPIYEQLVESQLDQLLIERGWMIPQREVNEPPLESSLSYKVLQPDRVPFISYPYEWSFRQIQAAALRTLEIQQLALDAGLSLKDASAFNIQFVGGQPVLIDTLSFEPYVEGKPWVAYRQFCQHFVAPLALMSRVDPRLATYFRFHLDGFPLDLTSRLLPWTTWLNPRLLIHLHWHARSQRSHAQGNGSHRRSQGFSRLALMGLLDSLRATVESMRWDPGKTEWADYYVETNYTDAATSQKLQLVAAFLDQVKPATVWDLGANTGRFSRLAAESGADTVAFDIDPACVERNFREVGRSGERRILPLCMDLANPSPALGWDHSERHSLLDRGPADLVMALALVHHLAIGNNLPLGRIASFLRQAGAMLIIEFVPKSDSQVQRLLAGRDDVFPHYTQEQFEAEFAPYFCVERAEQIIESDRTLYLMRAQPE